MVISYKGKDKKKTKFERSPIKTVYQDGLHSSIFVHLFCEWSSGLMVSVLDSGLSGLGLSPSWSHCVVLLGKTLKSHSASLIHVHL